MSDTNHHDDAHAGHGNLDPLYLKIFGALILCTAVSFITVSPLWPQGAEQAGHIVVMIVAFIKATLVAMFFMHLKWDWNKLYFMLVPSLVVGTVLMCALLPDIAFSDTRITNFAEPPPAATVRPAN